MENEISIKELLLIVKNKIKYIAAAGLVFGLLAFVFSSFEL